MDTCDAPTALKLCLVASQTCTTVQLHAGCHHHSSLDVTANLSLTSRRCRCKICLQVPSRGACSGPGARGSIWAARFCPHLICSFHGELAEGHRQAACRLVSTEEMSRTAACRGLTVQPCSGPTTSPMCATNTKALSHSLKPSSVLWSQQMRAVAYCKKVGCSERAPAPYNTKHKAGAGIQAACSPQADAVVTV